MAPILRFARMAGACTLTALLVCAAAAARAQEPSLAEYTHYPLFQTGTVAPRIMVVLDNSGSMNFPAYGDDVEDWPAQKTIPKVYDGKVCGAYSSQVKASWNDGNEQKDTGQIVVCDGDSRRPACSILTLAGTMTITAAPTAPRPVPAIKPSWPACSSPM